MGKQTRKVCLENGRVDYRESHEVEHLVGARGNVRVRDDAGAAGRLHPEVVLHGGERDVGAGSAEDAGQDDRLHLLRAHGDGHENLHITIQTISDS